MQLSSTSCTCTSQWKQSNVGVEDPEAGGLSDDQLDEDALEEALDAEEESDVGE